VEQRYVDEVQRALHDVPARARRPLLDVLRADLAERPPADSWDELVHDVGTPVECASAIRVEHDLPAHVGFGAHVRAVRPRTGVLLGAVIVLAGALGAYQRWVSAEPTIINSCSGVNRPDEVAVESREAGGVTEERISYVDGATVGLGLCLSSPDEVEILDVSIDAPKLTLFQPTVTRAADMALDPDELAPPLDRTWLHGQDSWLRVTIEGQLTGCEWYSPEVGSMFDTGTVRYRFRGRTRSMPVDLNTTYTFVSPPDERCPRPREHG
jgi:hypothetical protein